YVPRRYLDRTRTTPMGPLQDETEGEVTVIGTITDVNEIRRKGKTRLEAWVEDETGGLKLVWFRRTNQVKRYIKPGFSAAFSGKVRRFGRSLQIAHPEVMSLARGEAQDIAAGRGRWVALYPGNRELEKVGLDENSLRKLMDRLVGEYINSIVDPWPADELKRLGLPDLRAALKYVHRPRSEEEHDLGFKRLKFDELVMLQLLWAWVRRRRREARKGIAYPRVGETTRAMIEKLPFELTGAQKRVLREIWKDMSDPHPMSRLLQGDVGSGKTLVALVTMTIAVENGYQAALMAPTEILAEQHYLTSHKFLEGLGVQVELLTGGMKAAVRRERIARLAGGMPSIAIGTHALIQDTVEFPRLGMVVIDEQHRFGVAQRLKLTDPQAGTRPDVLVMTATPIPRSLALSLYGDLDVSKLDEYPPGRGEVTTLAVNGETGRDRMYADVRRRIEQGGRAYIIFPLVEESEKVDLQAAVESREQLQRGPFRGLQVGLLHGRMKMEEKDEAMERFRRGDDQILVSTTVIEVGVDVPEATEMVIEHAERFGLAQLHQLRGRIGRGGHDSRCYLVGYPPVGETARNRIRTMVRTRDGFEVAEMDLRLRGAGDFFGVRQHGMPEMRFADISEDQDLLLLARNTAEELINRDPELKQHPALKREFERAMLPRANLVDAG
ncbi:ATP-dependent DNA helicase RecG, partial [bacterium]|nr:ATP-dependent DNA helicase RecG [bacterium]